MHFQSTLRTVITLVAAAVVAGSVVAPGAVAVPRAESPAESLSDIAAEVPGTHDDAREPTVDIDCAEQEARIAAPDDYEYSITVSSVGISPSGTSSRSSSGGTYDGDETVSIEEDGFTFVFVTDASSGETAAAAYENCALAETTTEGTPNDEDAAPSIRIDCNESAVRIAASEGYEYGLTVGSVGVAPGDLDSSSVGTSEEGNASIPFDGDLVYVFVEGESSDEPTASAVEYCGPVPSDDASANATTRQTATTGITPVWDLTPK